jgi:hypothetical protein
MTGRISQLGPSRTSCRKQIPVWQFLTWLRRILPFESPWQKRIDFGIGKRKVLFILERVLCLAVGLTAVCGALDRLKLVLQIFPSDRKVPLWRAFLLISGTDSYTAGLLGWSGRIRTTIWSNMKSDDGNRTLSLIREKQPNHFPLRLISSSKRSNFENRTEWGES